MLVLSRKVGESILIDGGITLTVVEIHGNRVRLGIRAPENVRVLREELAAFQEWSEDPNGAQERDLVPSAWSGSYG